MLLYPSTEKVIVVIAVINTITTNYNITQHSQRWHSNLPAHNREPGATAFIEDDRQVVGI